MNLLPWQQQHWAQLHSYIVQQRIPQALLMTGTKGLGKQQLARQFAGALLCPRPEAEGLACGRCASCRLFNAETHPDFIVIQPDEPGKLITVELIRNLITRISLKPQFETYRVVMVNPADMMNANAANAFLKCLEEPTERTVIILITDRPVKLPATIVSRCQKLALAAADKEVCSAWLKQQKPEMLPSDISALLGLAQNAPLLALDYANDGALSLRNECFNDWMALAKQQRHPVIIAENWQKFPESSLIFWMTSWIIDLVKCYYHARSDNLYNPDFSVSLQALSLRLELKKLYKLYDLLLISRQRLDTQINKQSLFEEILIQWHQLNESNSSWQNQR